MKTNEVCFCQGTEASHHIIKNICIESSFTPHCILYILLHFVLACKVVCEGCSSCVILFYVLYFVDEELINNKKAVNRNHWIEC